MLKTDGDFNGECAACLHCSKLKSVQDLRNERAELVHLHDGDKSIWHSPDVQLLARAKLLKDLQDNLATSLSLGGSDLLPDWLSFLRRFLRTGGVVEAEPPAACLLGRAAAHLLVEPDGEVQVQSTQTLLVDDHRRCVGALYPQTLVPDAALRSAAESIGNELYNRGELDRRPYLIPV